MLLVCNKMLSGNTDISVLFAANITNAVLPSVKYATNSSFHLPKRNRRKSKIIIIITANDR